MENMGLSVNGQPYTKERGQNMFTVSDIVSDINRGCIANNMLEDKFSYRIVFFVNEGNRGQKYYVDTSHSNLRKALENIIRKHLSLTNCIVIGTVTVLKNRKCVSLLSKSYAFSLDEYFKRISGNYEENNRNRNIVFGRYAVR